VQVWEESVIHTPRDTLIVALSATMRNCKDIRDWFVNVQGPTDLIMSDFRPVPLLFKYADRTGISNLFDKLPNKRGQPRLNRRLLPGFEDEQRDGSGFKERRSYESGRGRRGRGGGRGRRDSTDGEFDRGGGRERRFGGGGRGGGGRGGGMQEVPSFGFTVRQLGNRDMLPAIFFIFSRAGCDKAAEEAAMEKTALVNEEEKAELRRRLTVFATNHKEVAAEDRIRLALKGIASHHAGLMPLWKSLVEELFQDNLIKVVFATETLAAGINMPARTTVITALSKRTNDGITSLTANELRQMCGRAGRRGKDTVGHSVIMKSRWEGAPEGFTLVTMPADPLVSKFSPNYGMVLNLLEQRPIAECKQIVERSFGSFMAQRRKGAAAAEEGDLEAEVEEAELLLQTVDVEELKALSKQAERLKSEERVLKFLRIQAAKNAQAIFEDTLPYAAPGTPLLLRPVVGSAEGEDMGPESAVLLDFALSASDSPLAFFAALTQRNKFRIVTHQAFAVPTHTSTVRTYILA
jgi:superfamily II RNA helicase